MKKSLVEKLVKGVLFSGKDFNRKDVTFDRYRETPIKCATRKKRSRGHASFRRVIKDGSVPLHKNWSNALALDKNKADFVRFLSEKLLATAPVDKVIIVCSGFKEEIHSSVPAQTSTRAPLKVSMKWPTLE